MSLSSNNLYKAVKSPEQLLEDKAVLQFFRKQIQIMRNDYLISLNKDQRRANIDLKRVHISGTDDIYQT